MPKPISRGSRPSFNPVLGFLVPATRRKCEPAAAHRVSIPFWVFWSLRRGLTRSARTTHSVSIPFWVFWSLRRRVADILRSQGALFQSRSGFSGPCDTRAASRPARSRPGFNPVLGFLVPATCEDRVDGGVARFQSRSGFSGPCDETTERDIRSQPTVSIPFWVFWSLRRQPVRRPKSYRSAFQSRSGFSGPCDRLHEREAALPEGVSIPFWVFWSLRQDATAILCYSRFRFQSRSGFSGPCDMAASTPRSCDSAVSIPFWVFWSLRQIH